MVSKSEVMRINAKKMGRPTENPKHTQLGIRFDEDTLTILDRYCEKESISRAEGVRMAVRKLDNEKE